MNPYAALNKVAQVRATATEIERWRRTARKAGKKFSEWAREMLNRSSQD